MSIRYGRLKTKANRNLSAGIRPLAFVGEAMKRIYVVGTADTKGEELAYLAERVKAAGGNPLIVDVGIAHADHAPSMSPRRRSRRSIPRRRRSSLGARSRQRGRRHGRGLRPLSARRATTSPRIVGIGGGGGTSIVTAGMRALPIGLPKLMVSTLASGDVGAYVDVTDITMMYSVTDIAGLNSISRVVLANAAYAIAGMARATVPASRGQAGDRPHHVRRHHAGVTQAVEQLRADYDCLVFHATGTGGRAMEKLVDSALLVGVIDVTTTEICDLLFDGVSPPAPTGSARSRAPACPMSARSARSTW